MRLSALGTEFVLGIVVMLLIGLGIDHLLGTEPIGVVTGTILGVLASGYNFMRQARALVNPPEARKDHGRDTPDDGS